MRQKNDTKVKSNAFKRDLNVGRPKTRAYIKQETEDNKESLNCALYSPVKIESPSLEISKYENSNPAETLHSSSKVIKNKRCSICNITFHKRELYLEHELHSHTTKQTPVINLATLCCNICNKSYSSRYTYRRHMRDLNNIHIPYLKPRLNPSKAPDIKDPNNYCMACNYTFKSRYNYNSHLIKVHRMSHLKPLEEPRKPKSMRSTTFDILNLYCDVCQKGYAAKRTYIRHLVHFHKMTLPDVYSEPSNFDAKNRYCKVYDMKYGYKLKFIIHLQKIHHIAPTSSPKADDQDNYCASCDRTFFYRKSYLFHLSSAHLDQNPELYQGMDCKSPSKRNIQYKRYCGDCQKVFGLKLLYQIHMEKIHGVEPPSVDDSYVNNANNHCRLCDKTYSQNATYRTHLKREHNISVPSISRISIIPGNIAPVLDLLNKYCNVCDRIYQTLGPYRNHMSKCHLMNFHEPKLLSSYVNRNKIPVIDELGRYCTAVRKHTKIDVYTKDICLIFMASDYLD